jgi:hypothetical protein
MIVNGDTIQVHTTGEGNEIAITTQKAEWTQSAEVSESESLRGVCKGLGSPKA